MRRITGRALGTRAASRRQSIVVAEQPRDNGHPHPRPSHRQPRYPRHGIAPSAHMQVLFAEDKQVALAANRVWHLLGKRLPLASRESRLIKVRNWQISSSLNGAVGGCRGGGGGNGRVHPVPRRGLCLRRPQVHPRQPACDGGRRLHAGGAFAMSACMPAACMHLRLPCARGRPTVAAPPHTNAPIDAHARPLLLCSWVRVVLVRWHGMTLPFFFT